MIMITITMRKILVITDLEQCLTQTSVKKPVISSCLAVAIQRFNVFALWGTFAMPAFILSPRDHMEKINNNSVSLSTASVPLALGSVRISDIMCMRLLSMTCRRCWSMTIRVASCTGLSNWTLMWTTQLDMRGLSFVLTRAVEIYG